MVRFGTNGIITLHRGPSDLNILLSIIRVLMVGKTRSMDPAVVE